jgi:hypothetical protein
MPTAAGGHGTPRNVKASRLRELAGASDCWNRPGLSSFEPRSASALQTLLSRSVSAVAHRQNSFEFPDGLTPARGHSTRRFAARLSSPKSAPRIEVSGPSAANWGRTEKSRAPTTRRKDSPRGDAKSRHAGGSPVVRFTPLESSAPARGSRRPGRGRRTSDRRAASGNKNRSWDRRRRNSAAARRRSARLPQPRS